MAVTIYFGANRDEGTYSESAIVSLNADTSVTVIGDTVSVDQFTAEVIGSPTGSLITIDNMQYGTPVWFNIGNALYGKYYFSHAERISETHYSMTAISAMGLLDTITCLGGIYYDDTVEEVLEDIIGDTISYTVDSELEDIPIRGWLPICTKKEALHQLMLAIGTDIEKDANGDMVFYFNNGNVSSTIPPSRTFIGGTVASNAQATEVDVTEHAFVNNASDTVVTLFDNTNGEEAFSSFISFSDAPVHDLAVTGTLTVSSYNCNYAIVSGVGKLTGKAYTHSEKVTRAIDSSATGKTNVVTVNAGTLISDLNSGNVAQRLLAYYKSAYTVSVDIILDGEKSGDKVEITNPFGQQSSAFIKSMSIDGGGLSSAQCEMICGYTPCFQGNTYHSSVVLTGSGTYTVPAGVNYITVICVAGGNGGYTGSNGADGETGAATSSEQECGYGGSGGAGGAGGSGGKIFQVVTPVTAGQTFQYSCGTGGAGAGFTPSTVDPGVGTHTTFGSYDSDNGSAAADGIVDRYTGIAYGSKGPNGYAGGAGGRGQSNYWDDYYANGANVLTWTGGIKSGYIRRSTRTFGGNGGGGAAYGSNGGDARQGNDYPRGQGGNGANAAAGSNATVYGSGGGGGHGGGGGGGNGFMEGSYVSSYSQLAGTGGNGSVGGSGANGCVIIYI